MASEVSLNRLLAQNAKLKEDLERSQKIIKVSDACKDLVRFTDSTPEPLMPGANVGGEPNRWIVNPVRTKWCAVL